MTIELLAIRSNTTTTATPAACVVFKYYKKYSCQGVSISCCIASAEAWSTSRRMAGWLSGVSCLSDVVYSRMCRTREVRQLLRVRLDLPGPYDCAVVHRPENADVAVIVAAWMVTCKNLAGPLSTMPVWSDSYTWTHTIRQPDDCLNNPLQRVQNLFLRRLGGGLRKSTSRHLMLREFGCRPLVRGWLQADVGLWNRIQQLPAEHMLPVTVAESLALGGNVGSSWVSDFTAVLNAFGALPEGGLFDDGVPCPLSAHNMLSSFDRWLYGCWCDLPSDPRSAPSDRVSCCKYQQWFAVEGGSEVDPLRCLDRGRWSDCPDYVRHTAPLSRESVRALASFRLGAHDLDVETAKFQSRSAVGNAAGVARAARLCRFVCQHGVGDEMHMLAECEAYDAVRRSHADLFSDLGGWMDFPSDISAAQFRAFMHQPAHQVSVFCVLVLSDAGSTRRWM